MSESQEAGGEGNRRQRLRVSVDDVRVLVASDLREFPAKDLSLAGIGFPHLNWPFPIGKVVMLDLMVDGRSVLGSLAARVARTDRNVVGCEFIGLTADKQRVLHDILVKRVRPAACAEDDRECMVVYVVGAED